MIITELSIVEKSGNDAAFIFGLMLDIPELKHDTYQCVFKRFEQADKE